jgi:hypothetical protein
MPASHRAAARPAPSSLLPRAALLCAAIATAACSGGSGGGGGAGGSGATLAAIDVEAVSTTVIPRALTASFRATGHYTDGTARDLTATATWSVADPTVAAIVSPGTVKGLAPGATQVRATASGIGSNALAVTVLPAELVAVAVAPGGATLATGTRMQYGAVAIYSDGSFRDVTSSAAWAAVPVITATSVGGGVSASTTLTVTAAVLCTGVEPLCTSGVGGVSVDQASASIAAGTTFQFTASGSFTDGSIVDLTALSTWSSDDVAVATVSSAAGSEGLATGLAQGTANITAAFGGQSDFAPLSVTTAVLTSVRVSLPPGGSATVPRGMTQPLVATGTFSDGSTQDLTAAVGWTSSVPTCAAVSNAPGTEGLVSGVAPGTATITAAYLGMSGTLVITVSSALVTSLDVTSATSTVPVGWTLKYAATAHYTDASTRDVTAQAAWQSSNTAIATVSNAAGTQGLATSVGAGTASISATLSGKTGSAPTLQSIAVTPNPFSVAVRGSVQLTATGTFNNGVGAFDVTRQCQWNASPRKNWVTVRGGLVTGLRAGNGTVTAKKGGIRSPSASGTVN